MSIFENSLQPPKGRSDIVDIDRAGAGGTTVSMEWLAFFQQLWSWVAAGYVVIPCDVGGTANAITLTPRFRPEIGASGYVDLLMFSFTPTDTSTGTVTIQVIGSGAELDVLPAYVGAVAAGSGNVVAGVPYVGFYCNASAALSLPDRMVLK